MDWGVPYIIARKRDSQETQKLIGFVHFESTREVPADKASAMEGKVSPCTEPMELAPREERVFPLSVTS